MTLAMVGNPRVEIPRTSSAPNVLSMTIKTAHQHKQTNRKGPAMAKGKGGKPVVQVNTSGDRKNNKARKQNPGPAQMEKTNFTHVKGRTLKSFEKREAWKAAGGRWDHKSIPHWKTGKVYNPQAVSIVGKSLV